MTIPASTVPLATGYLYDQIKVAVNDPAVLVSYGPPGPNQPNDLIVIGNVSREVVPYQMVGSGQAGWLDETYTVDVVASTYRGGDNGRTGFERAAALADIVVSVVRNDPTLGGAVTVANPATVDYEQNWDDTYKGRVVDAIVSIRCRARI